MSKKQLKILLEDIDEDSNVLPFDSLHFLIGEIHYGGRVTDPNDFKLLMELLDHYLNEDVL